MKKSLKMLTMLIFLSAALFFTACLEGDEGGSKGGTRPMDERLIGWWECEDVTGGTGDNPGVFNIERNKITMMMLGNDDGEGADGDPEDKIDAGQLYGGNILSISSTADKNDDGEDLLTGTLTLQDTHKYVTAGDEYRPVDGSPDTETAEYDNWYSISAGAGEALYEFTDATLGTLEVNTGEGTLTLVRGAAPAVDALMVGEWETGETDDYDNDEEEETLTNTVTLAANGDFSMERIDNADSSFVTSESGAWGVYRSAITGERYLALTMTGTEGWDGGENLPQHSIFRFMRMPYSIDIFGEPDYFELSGGMVFERTGTDPALPAPDAALATGSWASGSFPNPESVYNSIFTFNTDNTFEGVQLYKDDHATANLRGRMTGGSRGHYTARNGEILLYIEETWNSSTKQWDTAEEIILQEWIYEIDGATLTIRIGVEVELTFTALETEILEPLHTGTGEWTGLVGADNLSLQFNSDGTYEMNVSDSSSLPLMFYAGTWGVVTIDSGQYLVLTTAREWEDKDGGVGDDDTDNGDDIDTDEISDVYVIERMPLSFTSSTECTVTITDDSGQADLSLTAVP